MDRTLMMENVYTEALVCTLEAGYTIQKILNCIEDLYPDIRETLRGKYLPGNLRVGGANLRPRIYARKEGFEPIPIISVGPEPYKNLSPFYLGPVRYIEDGEERLSSNVENHFQFHKLYEKVDRKRLTSGVKDKVVTWKWPSEVHATKVKKGVKGALKHPIEEEWCLPTENYWEWRRTGLNNPFGIRRPNGKTIPIGSLWNGKLIGLIESRIKLYEPAYRQTAYRSSVFYTLLDKLRKGEKLMILDLDGPKLDNHPNGVGVDLFYLEQLSRRTSEKGPNGVERYFPYGHGYVLCKMLLELLGEKVYDDE